jgi:thiamine-phosphate pyrophosphorylase
MLHCAITDRTLLGADAAAQREGLLRQARIWAEAGLALIQIREKDLPASEQIALVRAMRSAMQSAQSARTVAQVPTRLILNARIEIALAAGADGVHLPAAGAAETLRALSSGNVAGAGSLWVSVSCHTLTEVELARDAGADCILFAPVFGKEIRPQHVLQVGQSLETLPGVGLAALTDACRAAHPVPVLALGGVTAENASACIAAGASGIAAIRWFHQSAESWHALCAASQPAQRQTW